MYIVDYIMLINPSVTVDIAPLIRLTNMADSSHLTTKNPWWWIPTVLHPGHPYIIVVTVSVIMYKDLKIFPMQLALFTSLLALPWALKPIWVLC